MAEQLTFSLPSKEALGREDYFVSGANALAVAAIEDWVNWPLGKMVLVGAEGAGKTHLAMVWAKEVGAEVTDATALLNPEDVSQGPLVIEDIDMIVGDRAAETALFHVHNLMAERHQPLLMTSTMAPARSGYSLPDLQSRMSGTSVAMLESLDDALLMALVMKMFSDRQIALKPDVLAYALPRLPRNYEAVRQFVERTDTRALSEGRPLGKGLVRDVLAGLETDPPE